MNKKNDLDLSYVYARFVGQDSEGNQFFVNPRELGIELMNFIQKTGEYKDTYSEDDMYLDEILVPTIKKIISGVVEEGLIKIEDIYQNPNIFKLIMTCIVLGFLVNQHLVTNDLSIDISDMSSEELKKFDPKIWIISKFYKDEVTIEDVMNAVLEETDEELKEKYNEALKSIKARNKK